MNKTQKQFHKYRENKLVVICGESGGTTQWKGIKKGGVFRRLYEIMWVKLLKMIKHYRIQRNFHSIKK